MGRVEHRFIQANGLRLHCLDFGGDGRPVVCLHGVTGHAWVWSEVAENLAGVARVYSLDMRGFGDSQWSSSHSYSTPDHVSDLGEVLSSLGLEQVDLVGSSWGGLVALAFAAKHVGRVSRLALVDISPSSNQAEDDVPPRAESFADHAAAVEAERDAHPHASDAMVEVMASHGTRPGAEGRLYRKNDSYFLGRWPFRSDDLWGDLTSFDIPVLVVHAEKSFIPIAVAERMVSTLKDGTLVTVPESGHVVPVENPSALSEHLRAFLSG
jgi:pimeloyl-ACP methyl ester carboxylesterase